MKRKQRTFIAINLPAGVRKKLAGYEEKWKDVPAKWTPAENLHVTLLFLGDLDDQELADVCQTVAEVTARYAGFAIRLQKVAYGPEGKIPPRYIWAGGERSQEIQEFKHDLEESILENVDFVRDTKAFTPHITLARIIESLWRQIEPEERPEVGDDINLEIPVDAIEVMVSEKKKGGQKYIIIESHALSG